MKKYIFILIIALGVISCDSQEYDLEKMGDAVRSHMKYRDIEKGTVTKIEYLKALSYEDIPEEKRVNPDEAILCKVYIKGTWAYENSFRIYNLNDTIDCYFNRQKAFLRIDSIK